MPTSGPITPSCPGVPSRVIQGFFPGGQPRTLQPTVTRESRPVCPPPSVAPVQPRMSGVQPATAPGRANPIQPASRAGMPSTGPQPILPNSQRQGSVQRLTAARPTIARPILPGGARAAAVQPLTAAKPGLPQPILPQRPSPTAVQARADNAYAPPANFSFKPRGSGQPLPEPVQKKMEAFFNTNFADVRIHVGPEASSIGALAFTHGTDLYFAPGQYNPQTNGGQQLLGHELTHVVQQRADRVPNPLGTVVAVVQVPALEAEAERVGMRAASAAVPIQAKEAGFRSVVRRSPTSNPMPNAVITNGNSFGGRTHQPNVQGRLGFVSSSKSIAGARPFARSVQRTIEVATVKYSAARLVVARYQDRDPEFKALIELDKTNPTFTTMEELDIAVTNKIA